LFLRLPYDAISKEMVAASRDNVTDHGKFTDADCVACHTSKTLDHQWQASALQSPHFDFLCTTCHDPHGSNNLYNIYEQLETPNSGTRAVQFLSLTGSYSFADGDAVYDGVCEVCHTTTTYHRNNASGDHSHNGGLDCSECHVHSDGFQPTPTDVDDRSLPMTIRVLSSPTSGPATFHVSATGAGFPGPVRAVIYDVMGRAVRDFLLNLESLGADSIRWDGLDGNGNQVGSGVYIFKVESEEFESATKFVVLR
jgi:hypothetical protein